MDRCGRPSARRKLIMRRAHVIAVLVVLALAGTDAQQQGRFAVRAFGAAGDGKTIDTDAINKAIDAAAKAGGGTRSEEHTSELQSLRHLVCRLLLEKKKTKTKTYTGTSTTSLYSWPAFSPNICSV